MGPEPRWVRWLVSAGVSMLLLVGASLSSAPGPVVLVVAAVGIAAAVVVGPDSLAARAAAPVALAATIVLADGSANDVGLFATCVLAGWAATTCRLRYALALTTLAVAALAVSMVLDDQHDLGWLAWIGGTVLTLGAAGVAQRERQLTAELRAAQAGLADRARTEERERIAREMHDVMGHALTVSLLHISTARLALEEDPGEAAAALAEAERLAQQSLAEVRVAVSAMRGVDGRSPLPGGAQIDGLLESFRRAGTPVDAEVDGDLGSLTAAEGLTLYRVLQESLTNIARHAPGSEAHVELTRDGFTTRVVVDSHGTPPRDATPGNGLAGMRERVEALGGRLTAGPWHDGWRVEAVLPG